MGMILQGFEGDRSKNRAGKTLIISYASAARRVGVRRWEVGTIVTVVAKLSPLAVHFMVYTIRELFISSRHLPLQVGNTKADGGAKSIPIRISARMATRR